MKIFSPLAIPILVFGTVFVAAIGCGQDHKRAARAEAASAATEAPTVEPTPEATAVPKMLLVSFMSQNNANLGRWTVECPDGCPNIADIVHADNNSGSNVWFTDVNHKFIWLVLGGGSIKIEEL